MTTTNPTFELPMYWLRTQVPCQFEQLLFLRKGISPWVEGKDIFYNHDESGGVIQRPPQIFYRSVDGKAVILGIGDEAGAALRDLLVRIGQPIKMGQQHGKFYIEQFEQQKARLEATDTFFDYRIRNWMPFNQKNTEIFEQTYDIVAQMQLLTKLLNTGLFQFREHIGWQLDTDAPRIVATIGKIERHQTQLHKKVEMQTFDLCFRVNLRLPDGIAIGRAVSHGFGTVERIVF